MLEREREKAKKSNEITLEREVKEAVGGKKGTRMGGKVLSLKYPSF